MGNETNWKGYFAMPNIRNRERLTWFLEEELKGFENIEVNTAHYVDIIKLSIRIINDLPENLLCNALVSYDQYNEMVSWTPDASENHLSDFSLVHEGLTDSGDVIHRLAFSMKVKSKWKKIFVSSIPCKLVIPYEESDYEKFKEIIISQLKAFYEKE